MNPNTIKSISKVFSNVNKERSQSYSDYVNFTVNWNNPESYQLVKRVGRGKYSDVFLGVNIRTENDVIIKVLKPVRKHKIRREIKILENLRGHPNVITLIDLTISDRGIPSLIFEYINSVEYSKFASTVSLSEIQFYMHDLAEALLFAHSNGIMHRDVKPHNVIVDFPRRLLKLIDWGLADFYHPGMTYNVRVASRYYKSPELLVDYQYYDYSLDVWSYGCVFAGLIFQKEPIFHGSDNRDQIASIFGSDAIHTYLARYRQTLSPDFLAQINGFAPTQLELLINNSNSHLAHPSALSLIKACLTIDHSNRPTVQEILSHDFFKQTFDSSCSLLNIIK